MTNILRYDILWTMINWSCTCIDSLSTNFCLKWGSCIRTNSQPPTTIPIRFAHWWLFTSSSSPNFLGVLLREASVLPLRARMQDTILTSLMPSTSTELSAVQGKVGANNLQYHPPFLLWYSQICDKFAYPITEASHRAFHLRNDKEILRQGKLGDYDTANSSGSKVSVRVMGFNIKCQFRWALWRISLWSLWLH